MLETLAETKLYARCDAKGHPFGFITLLADLNWTPFVHDNLDNA